MTRPLPKHRVSDPQPNSQSRLRVVGNERSEARRLRRLVWRVALVLLGGLFVIGLVQGVVTQTQGRIDQLDTQLDDAVGLERELRLQRAELLSPARLATEARDRLGMVPPATIHYLDPATPVAP